MFFPIACANQIPGVGLRHQSIWFYKLLSESAIADSEYEAKLALMPESFLDGTQVQDISLTLFAAGHIQMNRAAHTFGIITLGGW